MAKLDFRASDHPTEPRNFDPLPEGEYEMMIVKSDTKATKAGTGYYLECEMHVVSGQFSGRRHWERFNISNPNATAEKIAKESLARLCAALGKDDVEDSEELHDDVFVAVVGIDKKDSTRNVIWDYKPAGGAAKPAAAKPAAAPAAKPAARPWG